jgi:putative transposase
VYLVDKRSGLSWGRAHLTVAIDEASLAIVGFQISESPRSTVSAISCLASAIQTKDMNEPEYAGCKGKWVGYGVPGVILMDNALYNHSEAVEIAITDMGAIPGWSKPYTPTGKSQIENLNHIIKQEFSQFLPGYRGRKGTHGAMGEGIEAAELDLEEFRKRFVRWVVDVYSNTPRRNGMTPREIWDAHYTGRSPLLPHSIASTLLIGTLPEEKTLRSTGGIVRKRLHYQSAGLQVLRASIGASAKVKIRYDPFDLSRIYVQDGQNYMEVPCVQPSLPVGGLTDYQQTLFLQMQRRLTGKSRPTDESLMEARREVRAEVERARGSKKFVDRKRAMRAGTIPEVGPTREPAASVPSARSMSELTAAALDKLSTDDVHYSDKLEAGDDI